MEKDTLLEEIVRLLEDKKVENIRVMYVAPATTVTDWFVIGTVNSAIHGAAVSREVEDYLDERDIEYNYEGSPDRWRLLDLGRIIVHLFTPEAREYYKLEELWERLIALAESRNKLEGDEVEE